MNSLVGVEVGLCSHCDDHSQAALMGRHRRCALGQNAIDPRGDPGGRVKAER